MIREDKWTIDEVALFWFTFSIGMLAGFIIPNFTKIILTSISIFIVFYIGSMYYNWMNKKSEEKEKKNENE